MMLNTFGVLNLFFVLISLKLSEGTRDDHLLEIKDDSSFKLKTNQAIHKIYEKFYAELYYRLERSEYNLKLLELTHNSYHSEGKDKTSKKSDNPKLPFKKPNIHKLKKELGEYRKTFDEEFKHKLNEVVRTLEKTSEIIYQIKGIDNYLIEKEKGPVKESSTEEKQDHPLSDKSDPEYTVEDIRKLYEEYDLGHKKYLKLTDDEKLPEKLLEFQKKLREFNNKIFKMYHFYHKLSVDKGITLYLPDDGVVTAPEGFKGKVVVVDDNDRFSISDSLLSKLKEEVKDEEGKEKVGEVEYQEKPKSIFERIANFAGSYSFTGLDVPNVEIAGFNDSERTLHSEIRSTEKVVSHNSEGLKTKQKTTQTILEGKLTPKTEPNPERLESLPAVTYDSTEKSPQSSEDPKTVPSVEISGQETGKVDPTKTEAQKDKETVKESLKEEPEKTEPVLEQNSKIPTETSVPPQKSNETSLETEQTQSTQPSADLESKEDSKKPSVDSHEVLQPQNESTHESVQEDKKGETLQQTVKSTDQIVTGEVSNEHEGESQQVSDGQEKTPSTTEGTDSRQVFNEQEQHSATEEDTNVQADEEGQDKEKQKLEDVKEVSEEKEDSCKLRRENDKSDFKTISIIGLLFLNIFLIY